MAAEHRAMIAYVAITMATKMRSETTVPIQLRGVLQKARIPTRTSEVVTNPAGARSRESRNPDRSHTWKRTHAIVEQYKAAIMNSVASLDIRGSIPGMMMNG